MARLHESMRRSWRTRQIHSYQEAVADRKARLDVLEDEDSATPDLVLLDLNMPVLDGYGLLTHQRRNPHSPVCQPLSSRDLTISSRFGSATSRTRTRSFPNRVNLTSMSQSPTDSPNVGSTRQPYQTVMRDRLSNLCYTNRR